MPAPTRRAPRWSRTACCRKCFSSAISRRGLISNIYKGRVSRVLPGMQAAFIEIGMERTAFLHASDIFDPRHEATGIEAPRTKTSAAWWPRATRSWCRWSRIRWAPRVRGSPPTSRCPRAISSTCRRDAESACRRASRTRPSANGCAPRCSPASKPEEGAGYIVRTAAEDAPPEALRADMMYLRKLWEFVRQKGLRTEPGHLVHADLPLHLRILRDLLRPDVERVLIDQPSAHREMREFAARLHSPTCCRESSCTARSARYSSCTMSRRRFRRRWTGKCR